MKNLALNTHKILALVVISVIFSSSIFAQSSIDNDPNAGITNGEKTPYEQGNPDPNNNLNGIDTKDNFKDLTINSKDGIVFLSLENSSNSDLTIYIFDITGKLVTKDNVKKNNASISKSYNFSDKAKSIYILKIIQDKQSITKKIYI
ncbi:MAG: T9SS type A sorting domain-containing protein [Bacteroidetes bacterium]|jgi:hypothetical protein|nr:T9SS type A sorting domain-containing protein [Bacteroidota bacterium]MBT6686262.1 T9SS type A sorting domain-containing protein [Bacteroidota bacterium]MBT7142644.1 T9SS type A sorting domain-containing protein [Bacteroidota bacterium]MBT7492770.1 T9SS type A sorting domain-containing protein [Bacteroidota bacterium]